MARSYRVRGQGRAVVQTPLRPASPLAESRFVRKKLPKGVTDDPGNKADSPETVREIEAHNAKYDALCPPSE